MGAIFAAAHAAMAAHQPLSVQFSRPHITPSPVDRAPPASQQIGVHLHGALFFVTYSTDEDGAWVDLIQCGGKWWEIEQVHRPEWREALNDALTAKLLAMAHDEAQP